MASALAALLKGTQKLKHEPWSVIPRIERHLAQTKGKAEDRRDGKFHPSDLSKDFCPRAWAVYNFHPQGLALKSSGFAPQLLRIFDNGHHLHARLQGYVQEMGSLWGKYVHQKTGQVHVGLPPKEPGWVYGEVKLRHEGDSISGSTDGILLFDGRAIGLELKSINANGFRKLDAGPNPDHEAQALIYLHCLEWMRANGVGGVDQIPALDGFIILYENKDNQALEEFWVANTEENRARVMDPMRPLMAEALAYPTTKQWPTCHCKKGKDTALCKAVV